MSDVGTPFLADRGDDDVARAVDEIVELMQELEEGDTVRVVSETQDVMARVVGEVDVWRDWEDDLIMQAPLKVYGDSEYEHRRDSIEWIGFGPVDIGVPGRADVERVDELHVM